MKVENMTSSKGNKVANQFIIHTTEPHHMGNDCNHEKKQVFQSYSSIIAEKVWWCSGGVRVVRLDINKWDYSKTTGKYRNIFLGETKKETQAKIDSGEYILTDLN